jgi:hypothetical protein
MKRVRQQRAGALEETPELAGLAERGELPQDDFGSKVVPAVGAPMKLQKLFGAESAGTMGKSKVKPGGSDAVYLDRRRWQAR